VKPYDWVNNFDELFSRKTKRGIVYKIQLLGPQYIEELDNDLTKQEIRENKRKSDVSSY
jgi:hypothetical protein